MDNQTTNKPIFIPYKKPDEEMKEAIGEANQNDGTGNIDLGHAKLLSCLYFVFDAFERSGLDFFLVKDTARKAKTEYMLEGDHIDVGLRRLEWANDQKDLLFAYLDQEGVGKVSELPDSITYKWQDIPFTIHFYEDNPCVTALVPVVYEHEHFKIPNQFERFEKEFDK